MVVGEILKAVLGVSCTSVRLIGEGIQKDVRGGFGGNTEAVASFLSQSFLSLVLLFALCIYTLRFIYLCSIWKMGI